MSVTSRFQNSSKRLVNHFGKLRNYLTVTSTYDPETQVYGESSVTHSVKMFKAQATDQELKSPNLIGKEVYIFLIAVKDLPFKPKQNDKIIEQYLDVLEELKVEIVKEHWAGDAPSLWRVLCTKN